MHSDYLRYAIAWVPQIGTALSRFGKGWTGWCEDDPEANNAWRRRNELGISGEHWETALRGLHGPLGQPFRLAAGRSYWRLDDALRAAAKTIPAIQISGFDIGVREDRIVLLPRKTPGAVERLQGRVADAVHLVATRPGRELTKEMMASYGTTVPIGTIPGAPVIPSFVLPLTDRMPGNEAREMVALIRPRIAGVLSAPHVLSDLALMGDPGRGRRWRLLERYTLAAAALDAQAKVPDGMDCQDQRDLPPLDAVMGSDWDTVIV